ncbi:MAG: 50S ribosomal protein L24 [Candidatus Helarchaeota archaeon]|nr:50S ribosomal protein L24 [Candidatus Helarchaeota archaeon]
MIKKKNTKSPKKQRKRFYNLPIHKRSKLFNVKLIPDLVAEYGVRRLPVQRDDFVLITKGEYTDIEGKVKRVDKQKLQVFVEGASIEKKDGSSLDIPIYPSNIVITKLKKDKDRDKIIQRRKREIEEIVEEEII